MELGCCNAEVESTVAGGGGKVVVGAQRVRENCVGRDVV